MTTEIKKLLEQEIDKVLTYHGCASGDCPHASHTECLRALLFEGAEALERILSEASGEPFRDIPEHEHTHSLWVRCLSCQMWGIDMPTPFKQAAECGNCKSVHTVKYYPACCILSDREQSSAQLALLKGEVAAARARIKELEDLMLGEAVESKWTK